MEELIDFMAIEIVYGCDRLTKEDLQEEIRKKGLEEFRLKLRDHIITKYSKEVWDNESLDTQLDYWLKTDSTSTAAIFTSDTENFNRVRSKVVSDVVMVRVLSIDDLDHKFTAVIPFKDLRNNPDVGEAYDVLKGTRPELFNENWKF